jgi:hypothetical protein
MPMNHANSCALMTLPQRPYPEPRGIGPKVKGFFQPQS